jgi:hypothetical protein
VGSACIDLARYRVRLFRTYSIFSWQADVMMSDGVESFKSFTIKDVIDREDENPAETQRQADRSGDGRDHSHHCAKQSPLIT